MNAAEATVVEYLEQLVYSLYVERFPDGPYRAVIARLEFQTLFCSMDVITGLHSIVVSGEPVDGFYNIANLVKARGRFHPKSLQVNSMGGVTTLSMEGELSLDETIDVESLLKIAPFVEHNVSNNSYSIEIRMVES